MPKQLFQLHTRLNGFKHASIELDHGPMLKPNELKKLARINISSRYTKVDLGFLHASMIEINGEVFLLAGPSGVGKSTLAEGIKHITQASILANDWVAVEREGEYLFGSDLNFKEAIAHSDRLKIAGVVFLIESDHLKRDAYVPNDPEFQQIVMGVFDGMPIKTAQKLTKFWVTNKERLPFYCVVRRGKKSDYTAQTLLTILRRQAPKDMPVNVGVIGIGSVGVVLSSELGKHPKVQKVHLYNRSKWKAAGIAVDLNQALHKGRSDIYVPHDSAEDLFRRSDVVFLTFREKDTSELETNVPERWKKVRPHVRIIKEYAKIANKTGFTGTLFVITNPVDFLTYAYYFCSQNMKGLPQRTFQVYGVGLENDVARAVFYGRKYNPILSSQDVSICGNHSDNFIIHMDLPKSQLQEINDRVTEASAEVRSHDIRTVYGPVAAAYRMFQAYQDGGAVHASLVQENTYIGRKVRFKFSLPMVEPLQGESINLYKKFIKTHNTWIRKYRDLL